MSSKGDQAHRWAEEIYNLSTNCLMAHSIRAVERFIEERLDNPLLRQPHRIRVKEANTLRYMGMRAIAYIHVGRTEIKYDPTIDFEHRRRAIAHELAHILFAKSRGGDNLIVRDRDTEDSCFIFEKDLCSRHHKFYEDRDNINKLKFHSLVPAKETTIAE